MTKQLLALLLLALVNSGPALARLNIITTTTDLAAITEAVGGDNVKVRSLTPGTRDPHFSQAKPSMIRLVHKADLLIFIGAELETGWLPTLVQSSRNRRLIPESPAYLDVSAHINLLDKIDGTVNRSMGDVHAAGNPHYWLDPANGLAIADAIEQHLSTLDPKHVQKYKANLLLFKQTLNAKIVQWQKAMQPLQHTKIITYHTSYNYLAKAFNLDIRENVEPKPGIAPSAKHIARLVNTIKQEKIPYLLIEPYYEKRSSKLLNEKTGIEIKTIPQSVRATEDIKSYIDLFDTIVNIMTRGN